MEPVTVESVCPRCIGKGVLENFGHIRNGVCFRCWGCGFDLVGDLYRARKELARLRRAWASLRDRAAKETDPLRRESYLEAQAGVTARGHLAKAKVADLEATLHAYERLSKPPS